MTRKRLWRSWARHSKRWAQVWLITAKSILIWLASVTIRGSKRCWPPPSNAWLRRTGEALREVILSDNLDGISSANNALAKHSRVNTGHAFMRLRNCFQDRRRFFRGVGIERDHHATRIALEHSNDNFR